jgi:hypothetical protein
VEAGPLAQEFSGRRSFLSRLPLLSSDQVQMHADRKALSCGKWFDSCPGWFFGSFVLEASFSLFPHRWPHHLGPPGFQPFRAVIGLGKALSAPRKRFPNPQPEAVWGPGSQ